MIRKKWRRRRVSVTRRKPRRTPPVRRCWRVITGSNFECHSSCYRNWRVCASDSRGRSPPRYSDQPRLWRRTLRRRWGRRRRSWRMTAARLGQTTGVAARSDRRGVTVEEDSFQVEAAVAAVEGVDRETGSAPGDAASSSPTRVIASGAERRKGAAAAAATVATEEEEEEAAAVVVSGVEAVARLPRECSAAVGVGVAAGAVEEVAEEEDEDEGEEEDAGEVNID